MSDPLYIDLLFPVIGREIAADHAYPLLGALSAFDPEIRSRKCGVFAIGGTPTGKSTVILNTLSNLRIRCTQDSVGAFIPLAGRVLTINGNRVQLGVPRLCMIRPAPDLIARIVTIKNHTTRDSIIAKAAAMMGEIRVSGTPYIPYSLPNRETCPPLKDPARRVLRIRGKIIVGFTIAVRHLNEVDSVKLQTHGLGGRRHMGCGLFLPTTNPAENSGKVMEEMKWR